MKYMTSAMMGDEDEEEEADDDSRYGDGLIADHDVHDDSGKRQQSHCLGLGRQLHWWMALDGHRWRNGPRNRRKVQFPPQAGVGLQLRKRWICSGENG